MRSATAYRFGGGRSSCVRSRPVPALFDSLLYKYDAANLKLCIKARITDAPRPALFPFGTVGADEAYSAAEKNSFEAFPEGIRAGAEKRLPTMPRPAKQGR